MDIKKPSYRELEKRIRELEKETSKYKQTVNQLREQLESLRSEFKKQNIALVRKSIDFSDIMRQMEDKTYDLEIFQTGLEKTMAALQESEERYRVLAETSIVGITLADPEENLIFVNPSFSQMLGYTEEELLGMNLSQLSGGKEFRQYKKQTQVRKKGESSRYESKLKHKDGTIRDVFISASPVKGADGTFKGSMAVVDDITERKRVEEELRSSEERLKILFEYAPDGYYMSDLHAHFIDGNKAAEEIVGYKREELIGKSFLKLKLLSPLQIPKAAALLVRNTMGKPTGPDEFLLNRKNGSQVAVEISTFPVKIQGKSVVLGIARDITERKQVEQQIKEALREKELLLKEIHHRVKNNMQVISSLLNLQESHIENQSVRKAFRESQTRIRSMAMIHEKLYQSDDLVRVDIKDFVESLVTDLFVTYNTNPGTVHLRNNVKDVYLNLDTAIPCCLLINELVSNSLKYAFPGGQSGEIIIDFHLDKDKYYLTVKDNGVGFPPDLDFHNTGTLGLQLVNMFVKKLHGTIDYGTSRGSEVTITFQI